MLTLSLVLIVTSISPGLQYTDSEFYLNFSYNSMTNKAIARYYIPVIPGQSLLIIFLWKKTHQSKIYYLP